MKPTLWMAEVVLAAILGGLVGAGVVLLLGGQARASNELHAARWCITLVRRPRVRLRSSVD